MQIGISQCLLGERVRYDGSHKKASFLLDVFKDLVELVPTCPEVEIGMGTPREPIRMRASRLVGVESNRDWTGEMQTYAARRVEQLSDLSAYVLKSRSPSCGLDEGLFAKALRKRFPFMPMEQEDALEDPKVLDNFIERAFAYRRLRSFFLARRSVGRLVLFHAQSKLQLEVHLPGSYAQMFPSVAAFDSAIYQTSFMDVLVIPASPRRHAAIIDKVSKEVGIELAGQPLIEALWMLKDLVSDRKPPRLYGQTYLKPDDSELILRQRALL